MFSSVPNAITLGQRSLWVKKKEQAVSFTGLYSACSGQVWRVLGLVFGLTLGERRLNG